MLINVADITEIRTQAAKHSLQPGDCHAQTIQFTWTDEHGNPTESNYPTRYAFTFQPRLSGVLRDELIIIPTDNVIGITITLKP